MSKNIVILGANSSLAQQVARLWATQNHNMLLFAREKNLLETVARDLKVRGTGNIFTHDFEATGFELHPEILKISQEKMGKIDLVFFCYGSLTDQVRAQIDFRYSADEFNINFLSVASILEIFASYFEKEKSGHLAVVTSVTGDRGRKKMYHYASAKAALDVFLQGLRNRLFSSNVNVTTLRPGMMDTPMTAHLKKGLLFSSPQTVAKGIVKAIDSKAESVNLPRFWYLIMFIIRIIPEKIFKRLSI